MTKKLPMFWEDLKPTDSGSKQNLIFFLNRLMTAIYLVFLSKNPGPQCMLLMIMNIGKILYQINYRPFQFRSQNRISLINDISSMLMLYIQLVIIKGGHTEKSLNYLGFILIGNIILTLGIHFFFIFKGFIKNVLRVKDRYLYHKEKTRLELKRIENREKLVVYFPSMFLGFEKFLFDRKNRKKLIEWNKDLKWLKACKLPYKDMEEYKEIC